MRRSERRLLDEFSRNFEIIHTANPDAAEVLGLLLKITATEVIADPRPDTSDVAAYQDLLTIVRAMRVSAPARLHPAIDHLIASFADGLRAHAGTANEGRSS